MKFRDFIIKTLLADTDWLVGYDNDGNYIRIRRDDLASSLTANMTAPTLMVQYASNGSSWHERYATGDKFLRIKVGVDSWSDAIPLSVSAYDIWIGQGNSGTEEDFLRSLRGEDGEGADLSGLELRNISGYAEFLQNVNAAMADAKATILAEITETAVEEVLSQYRELQLSDIAEVRSLSEDDYITVVTADGLRKVKVNNLANNVAVRTVSIDSLSKSVDNQLSQIDLNGEQDGENVTFTPTSAFVAGTSHLFLNGQRLVAGTDYTENNGRSITMLSYTPKDNDSLIFIAVKR